MKHLAHDRREVDYRRFVVSNPDVVGRSVAELDFGQRFGGVITRIRRGDLDLLAHDGLALDWATASGSSCPVAGCRNVGESLGDSERSISEVDAFSVGIGLALGLAVGLISLPLPGGITLALGSAAGALAGFVGQPAILAYATPAALTYFTGIVLLGEQMLFGGQHGT